LLAVTFLMALQPIRSPDVWHHIACGRLVAQTHHPAHYDVFSCTAQGHPWIQYEWFAQLLIYLVHTLSGVTGLVLFRALIVTAAAGLLLTATRLKRGSSWTATAVVVSLAMLAASHRFFTRPEIFTFLLFSATRLAGEHVRQGRRRYIWAPALIMIPWVNMHGAWPAGLAWLGLVCVGETAELLIRPKRAWGARAVKDLWIALALAVVATLANPYGLRIWHVPFALSGMPEVRQYIAEWQRPDLQHWLDPRNIGAFIFLAAVLLSPRTPTLADWLVLLFFGGLTLTAKRHLALCLMIMAPAVAPQLRAIASMCKKPAPFIFWLLGGPALSILLFGTGKALWARFAAVVDAAGHRVAHWRYAAAILFSLMLVPIALGGLDYKLFGLGLDDRKVPIGAANFLKNNRLDGNLFNAYVFGNYLMFSRYPDNHVFIDGRVDMYGPLIMRKYNYVRSANQDWREVLLDYSVDCCVLGTEEGTEKLLLEALRASPDWALVYWDDNAAIYLRRGARYAAFLEKAYIYTVRPDDLDTDLLQTPAGFDRASADYLHKLQEDPSCARAMYGLAGCFEARGQYAEALKLLRTAVARRPMMPTLRYALGTILYRTGDFNAALKEFQFGLDVGAPPDQTCMAMSAVYRGLNDLDAAVRCARKATRIAPENWAPWWNLSVLLEAKGDKKASLEAGLNALEIRPEDKTTQDRVLRLEHEMAAEKRS
jgi:tetratricopeptide (TPR) repeat protein